MLATRTPSDGSTHEAMVAYSHDAVSADVAIQ